MLLSIITVRCFVYVHCDVTALFMIFFFNDTATTEIYTYDTLFPYTTLFRSLGKLAPAAVANAKKEAADLQAMIDKEQAAKGEPTFKLEPWDWAFYKIGRAHV